MALRDDLGEHRGQRDPWDRALKLMRSMVVSVVIGVLLLWWSQPEQGIVYGPRRHPVYRRPYVVGMIINWRPTPDVKARPSNPQDVSSSGRCESGASGRSVVCHEPGLNLASQKEPAPAVLAARDQATTSPVLNGRLGNGKQVGDAGSAHHIAAGDRPRISGRLRRHHPLDLTDVQAHMAARTLCQRRSRSSERLHSPPTLRRPCTTLSRGYGMTTCAPAGATSRRSWRPPWACRGTRSPNGAR
jgi:hypothetical protein